MATLIEARTAFEAADAAYEAAKARRYAPGINKGYGFAASPALRAANADLNACLEALKTAEATLQAALNEQVAA